MAKYDCTEINAKLRLYKQNLLMFQLQLKDLKCMQKSIIEMICLKSKEMSDIPRSITNRFHSVTENAALMLDDVENDELEAISKLSRMIVEVEILFTKFNKNDQFLLNLYIQKLTDDKMTWPEMARLCALEYGHHLEIKTIRHRLFKKILPELNQNLYIVH